jgi:hypothetical protein
MNSVGTRSPSGTGTSSPRWASGLAWPAAVATSAICLFTAFLAQSSRGTYVTSDGSGNVLQAWDMLHGNLLLHGWTVSDVSFYTIDLPEYMLVEVLRGFGPFVVHTAAALTYTLLVLLAAWLAKGRTKGREGITRALIGAGIMLAPELGPPSGVLLLSPDHVATGVPLLATWILVDRGSASRWAAPAVGLLLAWTTVGDPLAEVIGALPLAAVCALRVIQARLARRPLRDSWYELSLLTAVVCAVPVAWGVTRLIAAEGGWTASPVRTALAGPATLRHNAALTGQGIMQLYGAGFGVQPGARAALFAAVHLIGLALAAWALCLALRHYLSADLVVQVLAAAIVVNLAAYLFSLQAQDLTNTREIAAVLPFGAALAGRLLGGPLSWPKPSTASAARAAKAARAAMAVVLAGYAGMLAFDAVQPQVPAPDADLASWLVAHDLTRGLAGYWQAGSVTVDSGNRVQVRAIADGPAGLTGETWWEATKSWYTPGNQASFVISIGSAARWRDQTLIQQMVSLAGKPAAVYQAGNYTVAVWHENLMPKLH